MNVSFEKLENIGIFSFKGALTTKQEDDLQMLLMRAIHGIDRVVLNFRKVTMIDVVCRDLLRKAYYTSVKLKNPIIMTEIPGDYLSEIFNCNNADNTDYPFCKSSS
jgi:anti-anti-sigma regulatory factor